MGDFLSTERAEAAEARRAGCGHDVAAEALRARGQRSALYVFPLLFNHPYADFTLGTCAHVDIDERLGSFFRANPPTEDMYVFQHNVPSFD